MFDDDDLEKNPSVAGIRNQPNKCSSRENLFQNDTSSDSLPPNAVHENLIIANCDNIEPDTKEEINLADSIFNPFPPETNPSTYSDDQRELNLSSLPDLNLLTQFLNDSDTESDLSLSVTEVSSTKSSPTTDSTASSPSSTVFRLFIASLLFIVIFLSPTEPVYSIPAISFLYLLYSFMSKIIDYLYV